MGNVKIFIVEDDTIIRATLKLFLTQNNFEVAGEADEAENAFEKIKESKPDLALLDINLKSERDGVWLAQQLREKCSLPIVFLTAYNDNETLRKVMKTKPNGFLSKPFKQADVFSAINIALQNFSIGKVESADNAKPNVLVKHSIDFLFVKEKNLLVKVLFEDIMYLKSDGNYVEIHIANRKYVLRSKLMDMLSKLSSNNFKQIHQRYIVDIHRINALGNGFVMIGEEKIPVSKKFTNSLNEIIT